MIGSRVFMETSLTNDNSMQMTRFSLEGKMNDFLRESERKEEKIEVLEARYSVSPFSYRVDQHDKDSFVQDRLAHTYTIIYKVG